VPKNSYWIVDTEGVYAQVEGADQRDEWTKVRGWSQAAEPGPSDQVHVVNEHPDIQPGRLPYGALADWAGLGWSAGPPPVPADSTKDPVLVDQAAAPIAETAKSAKADSAPTK
jgi:hypothetical protein